MIRPFSSNTDIFICIVPAQKRTAIRAMSHLRSTAIIIKLRTQTTAREE
jgi:hypothetical protein